MSWTPEPKEDGYRYYGVWAGRPDGRKEDKTRCIKAVSQRRSWRSGQCKRKRGFGPEGLYCKQHDPAVVASRTATSQKNYEEKSRLWARPHNQRKEAHRVLTQIAEGHNDARGLAIDLLARWETL